MKELQEKILKEGTALNETVLKVDGFLNHQVDPLLMQKIGEEFANYFEDRGITKVFTIESSGIAPAVMAAIKLDVPMVILKKQQSKILNGEVYQTKVTSFTKGTSHELTLSKKYIDKDDKILLERNKFIGELYNNFLREPNKYNLVKTIMANYILEGIYFYSGFMFFYNLERNGKMPGSAQELRSINRDENTHLWLFRNIIKELQKEEPGLFNDDLKKELVDMMKKGVKNEIAWGHYVIGDNIQGINKKLIEDYIKYLGNLRLSAIGLPKIYDGYDENPALWVDVLADANSVKTDFFEAKSTAYAKAATLIDDL